MSKEVMMRYLNDNDNNVFFPMTHQDAVIGLEALIARVDKLEQHIQKLKSQNKESEEVSE